MALLCALLTSDAPKPCVKEARRGKDRASPAIVSTRYAKENSSAIYTLRDALIAQIVCLTVGLVLSYS